MRRLLALYLRHKRRRGHMVRPWALAVPILVLVVALPMLRPLRHPAPHQISDDEKARLATVQAIVEHNTLAVDATDFTNTRLKVEVRDHWYSDQPPTMSALLSGAYWVMHRNGLTFATDATTVVYLLTVLGVTIPAACAAGLVYRMGRLFELRRPWRTLLAAAAVLATGLISYATVLNPHVPAATLVLASAACIVHLTISNKKPSRPLWMGLAGLCAALAAVIDPSALPFLPLLLVAGLALRWPIPARLGGATAYLLGAGIPVVLHIALTLPYTGDFWQGAGFDRPGPMPSPSVSALLSPTAPVPDEAALAAAASAADEDAAAPSLPARVAAALVGSHGLLSHFPVLVLGLAGVGMIMHRHWPSAAKLLAGGTVAGGVFLVVAHAAHRPDWRHWGDAMFAARWFVVFAPLILFWAGAWLRRPHRPATWAAAGVLLAFSAGVSVVGALAGPLPQEGFDRYTAADAWGRLLSPPDAIHYPPVLTQR